MWLSRPSPETLSLIPQTVKQGMAIMFKLRINLRLPGMGARFRVETGQMKEKNLTVWRQYRQSMTIGS